jgi:hypothetical protein
MTIFGYGNRFCQLIDDINVILTINPVILVQLGTFYNCSRFESLRIINTDTILVCFETQGEGVKAVAETAKPQKNNLRTAKPQKKSLKTAKNKCS